MTRALAFLLGAACLACSSCNLSPAGAAEKRAFPAEVEAFVERRDQCDHFRGEEPYDRQRALEIAQRLAKACTGTDAQLARLRAKYARDPAVIEKLSSYEAEVE